MSPPKDVAPTLPLVALWRYDRFPFVLGGHVTNRDESGSVVTREFGRGNYFKPFRLVPASAGEKSLEALAKIRGEHEAAQRAFNKEWSAKLRKAFPWIGEVS